MMTNPFSKSLLERVLWKAEHGFPPFQELPGSPFADVVGINEQGIYVNAAGQWRGIGDSLDPNRYE